MDYAKRGADALDAGKYAEAITAFTEAIKTSPTAPSYFIKRATAYQRSSPPDFASALSDAENAVILAQKRAARELIVQAQMRRAIALFGVERYADAGFVLDIVKRMDPKEKTLGIWENKIKTKLAGLTAEDSKAKITVKETPDVESSKPLPGQDPVSTIREESVPKSSPAQAVAQTPANKIRHDWYQNADSVYFTLLAKGVPKDKAAIDIQERSLSISFTLINGSTYDFSIDPLYAAVDTSKSTVSILSTKIEIVLKKAQPGQKWHNLESSEPVASTSTTESKSTIPSAILQTPSTASAPSYPTSSRSGPKNWDKLVADITTKKPKTDEAKTEPAANDVKKNDNDDGDYDYDREDGDDVNAFFKKLYAGASDETRRAMMKSFTESNGTALSTNWDEVSKGTVATQPPNGMEAKNYGK